MEKDNMAVAVVDHMMQADLFSQWLGIQILEIREGYSRIKMIVRSEMMNGLGIVHGGIAFSLSDKDIQSILSIFFLINELHFYSMINYPN